MVQPAKRVISLKACALANLREILEIVVAEGHVLREVGEPARLDDLMSGLEVAGSRAGDELREVSVAGAGTIGHRFMDDPGQCRFRQLDADLLAHLSSEAVVGPLPAFEESPGSEPWPSLRCRLDADEDDRPAAVMDQSTRGPEGSPTADLESGILRRGDPRARHDRDAAESGEGVAHAVLHSPGHIAIPRTETLFKRPSSSRPRTR